ncbi:hypothetical protein BRD15_08430 [Halobacteriales archaeon SW_6_65_15]|nr:MAG: hypothetical protein BRD15_08430 [Halobacteriales archaeon SW_6_65_15]
MSTLLDVVDFPKELMGGHVSEFRFENLKVILGRCMNIRGNYLFYISNVKYLLTRNLHLCFSRVLDIVKIPWYLFEEFCIQILTLFHQR